MLLTDSEPNTCHNLEQEDNQFESLIGDGSFCDIPDIITLKYPLQDIAFNIEENKGSSTAQYRADSETGDDYVRKVRFNDEVSTRHVAKRTRRYLWNRDQTKAAIDLATEAKLLTVLSHQNIVEIHSTVGSQKDFLLVEKSSRTLEEKIMEWKGNSRSHKGRVIKKIDALWHERLVVILEVSNALASLHRLRFVHGGLKIANICFDSKGVAKIIDNGVTNNVEPDKYNLSKNIRYLAPEVVLFGTCGMPADIFSLSVLIWEIMTLEIAFDDLSPKDDPIDWHKRHICKRGGRPSVPRFWSKKMKAMVSEGWARDAGDRPSVYRIRDVIEYESDLCLYGEAEMRHW